MVIEKYFNESALTPFSEKVFWNPLGKKSVGVGYKVW